MKTYDWYDGKKQYIVHCETGEITAEIQAENTTACFDSNSVTPFRVNFEGPWGHRTGQRYIVKQRAIDFLDNLLARINAHHEDMRKSQEATEAALGEHIVEVEAAIAAETESK